VAKLPSRFLFSLALGASVLIALSACSAPSPVQPTAAESPQSGTLDRRVGDVGGTGGEQGIDAAFTVATTDGSTLNVVCRVEYPLSLPLNFFSCGSGPDSGNTGRLTEAGVWVFYIDKSGQPIFPFALRLFPSVLEVELLITLGRGPGGPLTPPGAGQAYLSEGTLAATINLLNPGPCQLEQLVLDVDFTGHLPHIGKVNGTLTVTCQT
jgi:hypothetical protein